jgi:hypothetical protein
LSFDWNSGAARLLKAEIAREGLTLARLAARLQRLGLDETEASVKNKLYRGTFSMAFFMQCMQALGHRSADVTAVVPEETPRGSALDGAGDS